MQEDRDTVVTFIFITALFILVLISFIVLILFLYQRRHIAYLKNMETLKTDFEKTLLTTELEIKEQTLQDVSQEIHDHIGASLSFARLNLSTINWNNREQAVANVNNATDLVSRVMDDLCELGRTLNTNYIKEQGLLNALESELEKIKKNGLIRINFIDTGTPVHTNQQKDLVTFRIIQEVLNNSLRHAKASAINIHLHYDNNYMCIEITDNGKGFEPETIATIKKGTGLTNILNRTMQLGGNCQVNSLPTGTTIKLTIPY